MLVASQRIYRRYGIFGRESEGVSYGRKNPVPHFTRVNIQLSLGEANMEYTTEFDEARGICTVRVTGQH